MTKYKVIESYNDRVVGDIIELESSEAQDLVNSKRIEEIAEEVKAEEIVPTDEIVPESI